VEPHIPIPFSNLHFLNPRFHQKKIIETKVKIRFFRPFPSVFVATAGEQPAPPGGKNAADVHL
jgi:hypothetical protein